MQLIKYPKIDNEHLVAQINKRGRAWIAWNLQVKKKGDGYEASAYLPCGIVRKIGASPADAFEKTQLATGNLKQNVENQILRDYEKQKGSMAFKARPKIVLDDEENLE